jgi:hypothetical protein
VVFTETNALQLSSYLFDEKIIFNLS